MRLLIATLVNGNCSRPALRPPRIRHILATIPPSKRQNWAWIETNLPKSQVLFFDCILPGNYLHEIVPEHFKA